MRAWPRNRCRVLVVACIVELSNAQVEHVIVLPVAGNSPPPAIYSATRNPLVQELGGTRGAFFEGLVHEGALGVRSLLCGGALVQTLRVVVRISCTGNVRSVEYSGV